jgi:hypothetical protein
LAYFNETVREWCPDSTSGSLRLFVKRKTARGQGTIDLFVQEFAEATSRGSIADDAGYMRSTLKGEERLE